MKKTLTKKSRERLIDQGESDTMIKSSANFWIAEFDRLMELKDRMEKSDERFSLGFTEKMNSVEAQIEVAAGHMAVELAVAKKSNEEWAKVEKMIYEYEN
jgi:hypothetical protein